MELETATPEGAPVESPSFETQADDNPLDRFLREDDAPPEANPEEDGDATEAPAPEGEAQEAEGQTEETPPVEDPVYKVKVRGEELDVPLSELLNGYSRTEDYKAKTAEVAELRRQAATEYADRLEQQVQLFTSLDPVLAQAQNLDWNALAQADPAAYVQFRAQYDARVETMQAAAREIETIRAQEAERQNASLQEYHQKQHEALINALPELREPQKLEGFAKGVVEYLKSQGFDDSVITDTDDHRALLIADKARKWDELQKAKTTVQTKQAPPAKQTTLKPRTPESPRAPKKPGPGASDSDRAAWIVSQLDAE